jgi:hypothetical protein
VSAAHEREEIRQTAVSAMTASGLRLNVIFMICLPVIGAEAGAGFGRLD